MKFKVIQKNAISSYDEPDTGYLCVDMWNDYSFVTQFYLRYRDVLGRLHDIGRLKIGYKGQTEELDDDTYRVLGSEFEHLDEDFFSLGQDVEFYENIYKLPNTSGRAILESLRDVVLKPAVIDELKEEKVFRVSLLREVSLAAIKGQFSRVWQGKAKLTDYQFLFRVAGVGGYSPYSLNFEVKVGSHPSTNIHAVIGRNGVGKTTLLNRMVDSITSQTDNGFEVLSKVTDSSSPIPLDYFSRLVSVSFSVFDPFVPPREQQDPSKGTCYSYIGLKANNELDENKLIEGKLSDSCYNALKVCFNDTHKKERWLKAIQRLGSDEVFASMGLEKLADDYTGLDIDRFEARANKVFKLMSSGHKVVFYSMTKLVATVEEKTLVLLDEPEGHLHPPLLSAFVRTLADLLHDRNGVAIIATHSPVVLQEIPRSCVWKIYRSGKDIQVRRPETETFGENVGLITSEVFGLEVRHSGFLEVLSQSVKGGASFEEICLLYDNQLGLEARAMLKVLIREHQSHA